jgi:hypothetical protein
MSRENALVDETWLVFPLLCPNGIRERLEDENHWRGLYRKHLGP